MTWKNVHEKAVKCLDWNMMRRTIATTLILSLLGTQMPLSLAAGIGSSGTGRSGSQSDSNAGSSPKDSSGDVGNDEDENGDEVTIISGTITFMDDGSTDRSAFDDLDLRLYVNGTLATDSNIVKLDKSGEIIATGANAVIPLENDLVGTDTDDSCRRCGAGDGFETWNWYAAGLPEADSNGDPYTYSIRDMRYHPATASNAAPYAGYALFYTAEDDTVVDTDGGWDIAARDLVYVQKGTIQGDFSEEAGVIPLVTPANLIPVPYADEDGDYTADAYGWIDMGAGSWYIADALMFNPATGEEIIWRGQVDEDVSDGWLIRYDNIAEYSSFDGFTDYIYEGGTIVNCSTTCQVTGTISWLDLEDTYGKRPNLEDFKLEVTDKAGQSVPGVVIEIEAGSTPGTWNYTITGLSVEGIYKVKAVVLTGYKTAEEIEFTAKAGSMLPKIEMEISTPGSVTIKAEVSGLQASEAAALKYTLWAEGSEYTGSYRYTISHANGMTTTGTKTGSQIEIGAGETVVVQLTDTVEDTEVAVTRTTPDDSGVLCIKEPSDEEIEENLYVFQYSVLKSVEACIVWNDNNNQYNVRPYASRTAYLDDGKLHLYVQLDDETQYDLCDPNDLSVVLDRLGLTEWSGFKVAVDEAAAEWYYSTAGLPAYVLSADGITIVEVSYWIKADDVDGYITTDKGWSQAPENARLDSWKFIYTSKTKLEIEVLWLDDNLYNGTRPEVADWKETVALYQVSTNPGNAETKEIDLTAAGDSFFVTGDDNLWKIEISNLPEYDEDGYPYTYYLVQGMVIPNSDNDILNDIKGDISYEAANSNTGRYSSRTDACYQGSVIKNTLTGELEYSATKIWKDGGRTKEERPTVTLTLWRYIKGDAADDECSYVAAAQVFYDMNGKVVTVTLEGDAANGYYVNVSGDLPAFDKDGHEYIYFVRESLSGTNSAQYICEIDNSSDGSEDAFSEQKGYKDGKLIFSGGTFTNRLTGKVNVNGTKTWKAKALQGMKEATITVALERKLVLAAAAWERVKNEADEDATKVIKGFMAETMTQSFSMGTWDRYDEDANEYEYRVVEIGVSLDLGDGIAEAEDLVYDATGRLTSYKITVNGETYSFSCDVETDKDGNETIINQLESETRIEIHKYWEKSAYDDLLVSVEKLYFHVYQNGIDICEELGDDDYNHDNGYIEMPVNLTAELGDDSSYYHWVVYSAEDLHLPKYDEEGAEYVYSIREQNYLDPYEGYSGRVEMWYGDGDGTLNYEHYGADVYNGPGKAIPVVKNWLDDGDILHREPVTVELFYKGDSTKKTLVLDKYNVWGGFFSIDENTNVEDYTVEEIKIGENELLDTSAEDAEYRHLYELDEKYIKTDEHIYHITERWDEDEKQWVISNLRIGIIDIHLEKQWVAGAMKEELNEYKAKFDLYQNSEKSATEELSYNAQSGKWEHDFVNLPKYDEKGVLYNWSLREVDLSVPQGEQVAHYRHSLNARPTVYGDYHTGDVYSYIATNTRNATGKIEFHKIWKDNNGKDGVSRPDIYLKFYRAVDKNEDGVLDPDEYEKAERVTTEVPKKDTSDAYHWVISYSSLPRYDNNGYSYIYFAEEGMPASVSGGWKTVYLDSLAELELTEYERTISLESTRDESYMLEDGIVVNYREGTTFVNGNKIWQNMGNYLSVSDYPYDLITLALYSAVLDENGDPIFDVEGSPFAVLDESGSIMTTGIEYNSKTRNFTYSFENYGGLPKYDEETGSLIRYYVKETLNGNEVGGFTWVMNEADFKLTNTYYGGNVLSLKVTKEWEFGGAVDNGEPINGYPNVTFTLYRKLQKYENGTYSDLYTDREETVRGPITLNRATGYVEFSDLPYYGANGHPYRYYIRENSINGYKITVVVDSESNTYSPTNSVVDLKEKLNEDENEVTITNIFTEETVKIQGTKTWSGDSGWNVRPDIAQGITLTLWRGTNASNMKAVDAELVWAQDAVNNKWTYTFKETTQPFYRYTTTGSAYTYYVKEVPIPGYQNPADYYTGTTSTVNSQRVFTANMENKLSTTELKVVKKWADNNNKYSTRPGSITVKLQRSTDSNAADNTFVDVMNPTDPGKEWTKTLTGSGTTDTGWTAAFSGLPVSEVNYTYGSDGMVNGGTATPYTYRAIEAGAYEDYSVAVDNNTTPGTTTITNTLVSSDLSVQKVWEDNDDQDGIRPSAVVVCLYKTTTEGDIANGTQVSETIGGAATKVFTLNAGNNWIYKWSGLPQTSPDGSTYYYYVVEANTASEPLVRYTATYSSDDYAEGTPQTAPIAVIPAAGAAATTAIVITNSYTPKEMSVTVEKAWVGADGETVLTNEDILPATITWQLQHRFKGNNDWIDVSVGGTQEATPGTDNNYSVSWSNLPVKERDASSGTSKVIEYRVEEFKAAGCETVYSDGGSGVSGDITKPDEENQKTVTVTNRLTAKTQVNVTKIWRDDLPGYIRQSEIYSITFKLQRKFADSSGDFADVSEADGLAGGFAVAETMLVPGAGTHSQYVVFADLPRYDQEGYEYAYRAVEAGFTLTPEYGGGYVEAVYNDSSSESGMLGGYTVRGVYTAAADSEIADTATGSNAWIANTLSHRKVAVEKAWDDADNQDGIRPTAVKVELLHDGSSYEPAKTATLSNVTEWQHEWKNLPANHADGTPFEYSVVEIAMEGLDEVQWSANNGYETGYSGISISEDQPLTVTNSRTPETINYTVYKYWDDSNEYDWSAERPDSVQVQLYRQVNGGAITAVENGPVTLYAEARDGHDAWTFTWTELPKYARVGEVETEAGDSYVIRYTVKEVIPEGGSGYEAVIDGNQITNQLLTTELTVIKEWEDQSNYYERRPGTITIQLQRSINGTAWNNVDGVSQELNVKDSSQSCTFIGLPVRDKNNRPYQYRAAETYLDDVKVVNNAVSGYKVTYEHDPNYETASGISEPGETVITNTLETVDLSGKKTWEDQGNHYGTRPESIKLTLKSSPEDALAEGLMGALVPKWSKNGNTWTYTYTGLPKYMADEKTLIVYSVAETVDAVYQVSYNEAHTNLTNTMKTGSLAVTKIQNGGYVRNFTFRLKLTINGVETLYTGAYTVLDSGAAWNDSGEVRQTDESGAIVIRRNQQFVITGLPAGAAYEVTEDSVSRFTLASTVDSTGMIPYQDAATASFTNKYTGSGGGGGGGGGGTTPTQPGTEEPTEPATEGTVPTEPESPTTPGDNGLVEVPDDTESVIVTDPNGNIIYEGGADNGYLDTSGWAPGTYTIYLLDAEGVPLGQMVITIPDNETPLSGLAKMGDTSLPSALLITILLGAIGGITSLVLKRRKEEE